MPSLRFLPHRDQPSLSAPDSNSEGSSDDGNWQREFKGADGGGGKHGIGGSPESKTSPGGFVESKTEEQIVAELQATVLKVSLLTVEEQVGCP